MRFLYCLLKKTLNLLNLTWQISDKIFLHVYLEFRLFPLFLWPCTAMSCMYRMACTFCLKPRAITLVEMKSTMAFVVFYSHMQLITVHKLIRNNTEWQHLRLLCTVNKLICIVANYPGIFKWAYSRVQNFAGTSLKAFLSTIKIRKISTCEHLYAYSIRVCLQIVAWL